MSYQSSYYETAAVCRRGHTQTGGIAGSTYGERCSKCGAKVITECESCGYRIRGFHITPGIMVLGGGYEPPEFCDKCGAAHPWVGRQGRIYELQNRLEDEDLDPATELAARELLDALMASDLDDEEETKRWARFKQLAPKLWESSQPLITTLVSAAVQGKL